MNPNGEGLLADLLWADPSGHISGWCANPRGVSFVFGLDVAQQWLRQQVSYEDTTHLTALCMQCCPNLHTVAVTPGLMHVLPRCS